MEKYQLIEREKKAFIALIFFIFFTMGIIGLLTLLLLVYGNPPAQLAN